MTSCSFQQTTSRGYVKCNVKVSMFFSQNSNICIKYYYNTTSIYLFMYSHKTFSENLFPFLFGRQLRQVTQIIELKVLSMLPTRTLVKLPLHYSTSKVLCVFLNTKVGKLVMPIFKVPLPVGKSHNNSFYL